MNFWSQTLAAQRRLGISAVFLSFLASVSPAAGAEIDLLRPDAPFPESSDLVRLVLEGGDRLSGAVLEEDGGVITLRTSFGPVVEIPRERVVSMVMVQPEPVDPAPLPAPPSPPIRVTGELELGAALISSADERRDYLADLDVTVSRAGDRLRFQGLYDVQRATGRTLRNRQQAILSVESDIDDVHFIALSGRYLRDRPIGLARRTSGLALLGRRMLDNDRYQLTLRGGPGFADESRVDGQSWQMPLAGWGVDLRVGFSGLLERFSFHHSQSGSIAPRQRPVRMLVESETSLRYRLAENLFLGLSGTVDFDSLSPDSTRTLERRLQLKIGFGW